MVLTWKKKKTWKEKALIEGTDQEAKLAVSIPVKHMPAFQSSVHQ